MTARPPGEAGPIHMAMHFGSVDLSALYGVRVGELPVTGPMEFVTSPLARAYFEHVRTELGVTIVPLGDAATSLIAALERGEAVGVVADRNIVGSGVKVELFGAPARLPIGPAVLSVQTGALIYLQAIERTAPGEWLGHTVRIRSAPGPHPARGHALHHRAGGARIRAHRRTGAGAMDHTVLPDMERRGRAVNPEGAPGGTGPGG